jgi:DUF1365 family protein
MGTRSRIPSEAEPALKRFAVSPFVQFSNQYPKLNLRISRPRRKLSVVGEKSDNLAAGDVPVRPGVFC